MARMNGPETDAAEFNRRDFLKGSSSAALMTMLGGVQLFAQATPEKQEEAKPAGPKVKCAVIGLGLWGREILDQLGRIPQADIAAICDNYPAMVSRSATKAPAAAQVGNYKAVLDNKDIQAVIVATPSHQHKDIAIAALQAGKHVYCEAPLANTIEEARAIALAAKNTVGRVFQSGLQTRCDPQRHWLMPFIRSGALGKPVMARAQWHKKQSWRSTSPSADREKALNWRLSKATSLGLAGEIGIHELDQAGWFFLNARPVAVTGYGSILRNDNDGRDVPDTVQLIVEYLGGARLTYDCTLANSFDAGYEVYYGSDAAVMLRGNPTNAWMFKEVDSPLLGWEVYARKDAFYKETGIALVAGASKQTALGGDAAAQSAFPLPTLYYALEAFLTNCGEMSAAVEDFKAAFDANDKAALAQYLATSMRRPTVTDANATTVAKTSAVVNAPKFDAGYAATVLAIKANEAITKGVRIELKKEMFELA
jgi:predicted dehydrogenase